MVKESTQDESSNTKSTSTLADSLWAIRPCSVYKEEYSDCTSLKARFHQYFIYGESIDCSQWQSDYRNCARYQDSNGNDVAAGEAIIRSEEERRLSRLHAHYGNTTWKKRAQPPEDWAKPLPEWMAKRNENTYLDFKQMEMDGRKQPDEDNRSYCSIM